MDNAVDLPPAPSGSRAPLQTGKSGSGRGSSSTWSSRSPWSPMPSWFPPRRFRPGSRERMSLWSSPTSPSNPGRCSYSGGRGGETVIEQGLQAGERVVTDGQLRLFPGAKVEIKNAAGQAEEPAVNISELFIRRPVMTTLVMLAILLFGIIGYRLLPVSDLPNVDFPTIQVSASLPGASPETMASAVATPLERQFSTIAGLDSMTSTSGLGNTQITLQFTLSRDIDAAAQDVQAAISKAASQLPQDMPTPPSYQKVNPGRPADPLPGPQLADPAALHGGRIRRDPAWPSASPWSAAWPRCRSSARRNMPCASS